MSAAIATPAPPATRTALVLSARELGHRYGPGRGLDPVSFSLSAPGIFAVTGANGAGKSTLLRILAGLLRPSHGASALTIGGRAVTAAERRRRVGFAAPELAFYGELSVIENLTFAAEARGLEPARVVSAALERVGLLARGRDRVSALSSGLIQRLRLAFATLHAPSLLLLDEPGSHLDDQGLAMLRGVIDRHAATGLVVLATNDEREWRLAGERIELRGGGLGRPA